MPKRSSKPGLHAMPFSIVGQVTGPPFSADLHEAAVRRHLLQEIHQRSGLTGNPAGANKAARSRRSAKTRKAAGRRGKNRA